MIITTMYTKRLNYTLDYLIIIINFLTRLEQMIQVKPSISLHKSQELGEAIIVELQ